jgi:hypothetical protein
MKRNDDELDRRAARALRAHTDEAARRARELWPSIGSRLYEKPSRRGYLIAAPALALAIALAVLLPRWLAPVPDIVSPAAPSAASPPGTIAATTVSPGVTEMPGGAITITAAPSRYSPLLSSAFGIHLTAADAQGNPVAGTWTASWGRFVTGVETAGGTWDIGDPQPEARDTAQIYWTFIEQDIPDIIEVRYEREGRVTVLLLKKDPEHEYFVRVAGPDEPHGTPEPTPTPAPQVTPAPGTSGNAFGLPYDDMISEIEDEYGILRDNWQEFVERLCAEEGVDAPDFTATHPEWPGRKASLTHDDLMLWNTRLGAPEAEALASIEAAMAAGYGEVPERLSDKEPGDGTRRIVWSDGTAATFAQGELYAIETTSARAQMPPGLAVGASIVDFIDAYGLPRVYERGATLSWAFNNNPTGNDHLFVSAESGTVVFIRISLTA